MFEFLSSVTSGDLSLLLISGYVSYQLVQFTSEKLKSASDLTEKFVNNVEVLANNSSVIARSMDSASDNLNSISNAATRFTEVTDTNNWRNNMMELVKLYIPLVTQVLFPKPVPTPEPMVRPFNDIFGNVRCNRNFYGCTGATGATGPSGPTDFACPVVRPNPTAGSACPVNNPTDVNVETPMAPVSGDDAGLPAKSVRARANSLQDDSESTTSSEGDTKPEEINLIRDIHTY